MKKVLFALVFIILCGCTNETVSRKKDPLAYLPENASLIIKLNDFQAFKSSLKNNSFLRELAKTSTYKDFTKKIRPLTYFSPEAQGNLCFIEEGKNNFELVFVSDDKDGFLALESVSDKTVESFQYEGVEITQYQLDEDTFFTWKTGGLTAMSTSRLQMENLIRKGNKTPVAPMLEKLYTAASSNKPATVFLNTRQCDVFFKTILKSTTLNLENFASWLALDFDISQGDLNIHGIALAEESSLFVNLFKNTHPLHNVTASLAPANALGFSSYSFHDGNIFLNNRRAFEEQHQEIALKEQDSIFGNIDELGYVNLTNNKAVILRSSDSEIFNSYLDELEINSEEFMQTTLHQIKDPDFIQRSFSPIVKDFKAHYYCVIEDFFVFAGSQAPLRTILTNHQTETVFSKLKNYETLLGNMADESSMLSIRTSRGINDLISEKGSKELAADLGKANLSKFTLAIQMVADTDFYHLNAILSKTTPSLEKEAVMQVFSTQLDADIATRPQFVLNHRTRKKEIVVQDIQHNLYLIASDGKVLWKKNLDSKIQGKITQVDLYKNGRLQLAFTTQNRFMVLDRNGDVVPPFNKKFDGLLNPLSVFDYENKKDYRFVVTTGNNIFMYDNRMDIVSGFNFTKATNSIKAPSHFRIGSRDYLVFPEENGTLHILDRRGNKRIKLKEKIDISDNNIYLYQNKFTLTNKEGKLIQIDNKGRVTQRIIGLNPDHYIDATSKTLVSITDNILTIKGKKIELDFGFYSRPKIFYLYDKIYVSVTDIQNQKVYLFDSSGTRIKNFPVYGTSAIDLQDIDNDRKLELVVKGPEDTILMYRLN